MPTKRILSASLATLVLVASAAAQFTSPAPLAWRWYQPTSVAPSGSPLAQGDTVFYAVGTRVFAMNIATGNLKWRFPDGGIQGAFRSSPVLMNGVLVVVGDNGTVYGLDPAIGIQKWSYDLPGKAIGQPVIAGQYVVIAQSDNKLVAISAANGQPAWANPITIYDGIQGQIGANGDDVLVFDQNATLYSISTITQKTTWQRKLVQIAANVAAVTSGNTIYLNTGSDLVALDAMSGRPRWDRDTRQDQLLFAPAVSATTILVVSSDGQALAYDLNGQPVNASKKPISLGSFPVASPTAVADNTFIVPTSNGAISMVDPTYVSTSDTPSNGTKPKPADDEPLISLVKVDAPSPDLKWSFVIAPITESATNTTTTNFMGGPGGAGGPAGFGGPGGIGGPGGTRGNNQNNNLPVTSVQAAAPAVLAGQTLLVPAKDGSLLAFDKTQGVDLTAPGVRMVWPNSGEQVSPEPPLQLIYKISDDATGVDVKTIDITIDGQPVKYGYSRDGYATVAFSKVGSGNRLLTNGRKTIVVTVSDWMGNKATKSFMLFIDNTLRPLAAPGTTTNTRPGGGPPGRGGPGGGPGRGGLGGGGGGGMDD